MVEEVERETERHTKLLPKGQKGCRKNWDKRPTYYSQSHPENCRSVLTNLSMALIAYRKAYDMVPHSWILKCERMFGVVQNIDREQLGKLEDSVHIKPGGTWDRSHQKRYLSMRFVISITVLRYHCH